MVPCERDAEMTAGGCGQGWLLSAGVGKHGACLSNSDESGLSEIQDAGWELWEVRLGS